MTLEDLHFLFVEPQSGAAIDNFCYSLDAQCCAKCHNNAYIFKAKYIMLIYLMLLYLKGEMVYFL